MQLSLQGIVPVPLREKINNYQSGIWKKSLALNRGDYIFVQAPSGTGKTTLIHILYGLRLDYEGQVKWRTKTLTATNSEELAQLRTTNISVIFQDMRLFPELTIIGKTYR